MLGLIVIGMILGSMGAWIWSLVDLLGRSQHEWRALGQDRTLWLLIILFLGLPGAIGYLLAMRPKLDRVRAMGAIPTYAMVAAAPPGWYPDPSGMPLLRWFDGRQWTPQTAPMPMGGPRPGSPYG